MTTGWPILSGTLTCSTVSTLESVSLDSVSPDSCVHISSENSDTRGEVVITATSSAALSGFLLVTDCPRWEIVAGLQYLTSVQGELLDSFEGTQVYSVQLKLPKLYDKLTLRLPPSITSCWLYSVQVVTSRKETTTIGVGHFDINTVNHLIGDGKQLSQKAENFKGLFEKFQAGSGASQLPTEPPKMSDLVHNPLLLQSLMQKPSLPACPISEKQSNGDQFLLLKGYIDRKFEVMEENILKVIAEKDREQSAKLDRIIDQLNAGNNNR